MAATGLGQVVSKNTPPRLLLIVEVSVSLYLTN